MASDLTIRRLKNKSYKDVYQVFLPLYERLFLHNELGDFTPPIKHKILSIIALLYNSDDELTRRLAYRMSLAYSIETGDALPLYDLSINNGLIPICSLIEEELSSDEHEGRLSQALFSVFEDYHTINGSVITYEQLRLGQFYKKNNAKSSIVVAPTSYGKSELVVSSLSEMRDQTVCIVVPTKSLLNQTKRNVLRANVSWVDKVISHPEMHTPGVHNAVYVLTQERLSRVLQIDQDLRFDCVYVDEAHNLLENDERNILLASVMKVLEFRNPSIRLKLLTPFLTDHESLKIRGSDISPIPFRVSEYVKSECFYVVDFRNVEDTHFFYDHFLDHKVDLASVADEPMNYVHYYAARKNLIYLNKPRDIQVVAKRFLKRLKPVQSALIDQAIDEISKSVHKNYFLIECLRRGLVYHHGSMTDAMRNYVEHLYRECSEIQYLISSSTLLEGVNLPIERIFLLSLKKGKRNLTSSQFKNLIGRVNRFGEIFGAGKGVSDTKLLMPNIHLVGTDEFMGLRANPEAFLKNRMYVLRDPEDKVTNVLLEDTTLDDKNRDQYDDVVARLENMELGSTGLRNIQIAQTEIGQALINNNVTEIKVLDNEIGIESIIRPSLDAGLKIEDSNTLMAFIYEAFITFIDENHKDQKRLQRLQDNKAQTFYAMFIDWMIAGLSFPEMIRRITHYWSNKIPAFRPVYVGSWGDYALQGSHFEIYTIMSDKNPYQKVNLAIVRIKEEIDFLDFTIFRYVDALNDVGMLDSSYYNNVKYGTNDQSKIDLIREGYSRSVASMLVDEYSDYILYQNGSISLDSKVLDALNIDEVGFLMKHEVEMNVPSVDRN